MKTIEINKHSSEIIENGFTVLDPIYTKEEIENIRDCINKAGQDKETFRKGTELFAIRQFLKEIPEIKNLLFTPLFIQLIQQIIGKDYFVVKSIYFDKPSSSNWYVAYHQDLTISVDKKINLKNFGPWTTKQNQFAVQAPTPLLENIFTLRIHLDDTDENNGALCVIPGSHTKKIHRPETIERSIESEKICRVKKGGIMIMKPLLMPSSGRTINKKRRRVLHIELSNQELPNELNWAERLDLV